MLATDLLLALLAIVGVQVAAAAWIGGRVRELATRGVRSGDQRLTRAAVPGSAEAVAAEVAKRQVAVLAEMADELREYDHACLSHARRFCEVMLVEWKRAGLNGISDNLPNDLEGAMRTFERMGSVTLDAAAQSRVRKDLEPNITVLLASAEAATSRLEENRFWLGLALEQELRAYVSGMARTFADLQPSPEALRAAEGRYRAMVRAHPEAARSIERLSAIDAVGTR